jgi:sulfide:quinone oxidoreductase
MTTQTTNTKRRRVLIAGGGVAALEAVLALHELAPDLTDVTVIAPNADFHYRPLTVREPFAAGQARHYPLAPIISDAGARLVTDELAWVDPDKHVAHTNGEAELRYDRLVLALGAKAVPRYQHAVTIDAAHMDEILHGVIQDVEGGCIKSLAFLAPGRMAWPLPLYELALMTAGRAYDMGVELAVTLVTPEDAPLAIFGQNASSTVAGMLDRAGVQTIHSAYAEVPSAGELVINPGDRRLHVNRVIALPELYGPSVRGIPLSEHGFLRVDPYGHVLDVEHIYAAGDCTEFPVKHGGVSSQQADTVALSVAANAGAPVTPERFHPVIHGMLLTGGKPVYLTAKITGGHGFSSQITDTPAWEPPSKIATKYLAPYLDALDRETAPA